ncbi:MAG: hypothetical protein LBT70_03355 [Holosporaceae bacterium]|jgi:hypothetical protein|nr:hypothetical protein [Holosporaceae bacterium]
MREKIDIIYNFGKNVIIAARDMTIKEKFEIVNGSSNAPLYIKLHEELASFNSEQKKIIQKLMITSIDGAINNFLWMMEQNNDKYAFVAKCKNGEQFDIEQESDGLCMGQWVFIDEYSKYNTVDEILETGKIGKKTKSE